MPTPEYERDTPAAREDRFTTTLWTVVLAAGDGSSSTAREALDRLYRTYWYPLYAYIRRRGYSAEDAQDLAQEFFARLVAKNYLAGVDRAKGKFRSFLLASLNHFLANEWDRARAAKRGGGQVAISLDADSTELRYQLEPVARETPETIYDRHWAVELMKQALERLRGEYAAAAKTEQFALLKTFLEAEPVPGEYAKVGATLGASASTVAVLVHRLRQRYRELVRAEVAQTVSSPAEIDDEMRCLFAALNG
jgi:RNA polymerase sigma-70 factor (ECF subfamily)